MEGLEKNEKLPDPPLANAEVFSGELSDLVNSSGHKQELDRNFGIWSICAMGVCADSAWAAGGGSLVGLGILYELYVMQLN
jgi:hypothetical protein